MIIISYFCTLKDNNQKNPPMITEKESKSSDDQLFQQPTNEQRTVTKELAAERPDKSENSHTIRDIYLAGGCFWGTEHYFKQVEGVVDTEVGYANGIIEHPTYKQVCTDTTQFAETVHVRYNSDVVSLEFLLTLYFKAIDPVSINQQGHDKGTQYRTGIYYTDVADLSTIEEVYNEEQKKYDQPFAVEKQPLENFYPAEDYHQDYLDKNPTGYCHLPVALFEFARKAKAKR
jgi:peptide methionine sulfoxide reductase msrA/msrB